MNSRTPDSLEKPAISLADRAIWLIATGFGLGQIPTAPGTWGTLWGLPIAFGLSCLPLPVGVAVWVALAAAGVFFCGRAAALSGRHDPGNVVFDEFAALPLLYFFIPFNPRSALLGFLLFRLFDIVKPWPARRLERLPGGWGIMADDLAAAVYATVVLAITDSFF